MLALMNRALEPSSPYTDKIMYMTSVGVHQTICTDLAVVIEKIKDLLSSSNSRLQGLQLLDIALQQNADMYLKGRWTMVLFDILKDSSASLIKEHACKVLCMIIPSIAKDPSANSGDLSKFISDLFPLLLKRVYDNAEWRIAASKCIHTSLKSFPQALACHKDMLLSVIIKQVSCCTSSKEFENYANCFSEIPLCMRNLDASIHKDQWTNQYLTTLNTMRHILNNFLSIFLDEDPYADIRMPHNGTFKFVDDEGDVNCDFIEDCFKGVRRFINMSKCLAKMLSTQSKFSCHVPVQLTLDCLSPLFQSQDKIKPTTIELQMVCSNLAQMQIAGLFILEAIIHNFNLVNQSVVIVQFICSALQASKLGITNDPISSLRLAAWKLLQVWLKKFASKISNDITSQSIIMEALMKDISIDDKESSQTSSIQTHHKSKKNVCMSAGNKSLNKSQKLICIHALKSLRILLYVGAHSFSKKSFQELSSKVLQVSFALHTVNSYPPPYDNDLCRKNLYKVLQAMVVTSKPDQIEPVQCAAVIFRNALRDPSTKVTSVCYEAIATCRLQLHPKGPPPVYSDTRKSRADMPSTATIKLSGWSTDDYVKDLPVENVSEASENATSVSQSFFNEIEIQAEEYMEVEQYQKPAAESQCNGEEVDAQSSSQCQDDIESDEEEEEEDDERSYGDEEINQEEIQSENMYIPSTNKLQALNPVHINPETVQSVAEPEYEELRPCAKIETTVVENSNKNMHLNGAHSIVPAEDMPSSSTQPTIANENGIYSLEDDEIEEEEGDEDEEEEAASFPAEKKVPEFYDPPVKRQKLETDETKEVVLNDEREQNSRSPTLSEMKADFCCNEVEDVQS